MRLPLAESRISDSNSTHIPKPQILISSGAHLSRYLVQLAVHHHFRSYVPFIKTPWARSMSTSTFVYLMSVATKLYGDIPTGKGDDDGTIFSEFLRESRYPTEQKHVMLGWFIPVPGGSVVELWIPYNAYSPNTLLVNNGPCDMNPQRFPQVCNKLYALVGN